MRDSIEINETFLSSEQSWVQHLPIKVDQEYAFDSSVGTFPDLVSGQVSPMAPNLIIATLNINSISIDKTQLRSR